MEWLCNCVRSIGEGSFVLYRKINTEVSSRKMKPCRWSCLWSQEKLAEHLELRISPRSIGGGGAGTEQQSVWVSPWGPLQRLVYGPASRLLSSSVLGLAATLSTPPLFKLMPRIYCVIHSFVMHKERLRKRFCQKTSSSTKEEWWQSSPCSWLPK